MNSGLPPPLWQNLTTTYFNRLLDHRETKYMQIVPPITIRETALRTVRIFLLALSCFVIAARPTMAVLCASRWETCPTLRIPTRNVWRLCYSHSLFATPAEGMGRYDAQKNTASTSPFLRSITSIYFIPLLELHNSLLSAYSSSSRSVHDS